MNIALVRLGLVRLGLVRLGLVRIRISFNSPLLLHVMIIALVRLG